MRNSLVIYLGLLLASGVAWADKVGILGDIHGNQRAAVEVLARMKAEGVTHIIGTGDFVDYGGAAELESILQLIPKISGVGPENTYFMPGNWEHETRRKSRMGGRQANQLLAKYGHLITLSYRHSGYVTIAGRKIMVSHFPQHAVPKEMIPGKQHLNRAGNNIFVLDTMQYNRYPDPDTEFEIFAHTHIAGHYTDPVSGKLVINAGTLHETKKSPGEPLAYAIYDTETRAVSFYRVGETRPVQSVTTLRPGPKWRCFLLRDLKGKKR